jgi:hypothetical protein
MNKSSLVPTNASSQVEVQDAPKILLSSDLTCIQRPAESSAITLFLASGLIEIFACDLRFLFGLTPHGISSGSAPERPINMQEGKLDAEHTSIAFVRLN